MKTPEEIKEALKLCGRGCYSGCPYNSFECVEELSRDALTYIQQLENQLREATKKMEQLESAQPKWISVEEGLPKDFVSVLGFMTDAGQFPPVRECYAICDGKAWIFPALMEHHPVSHWMSMPEPPKGDV